MTAGVVGASCCCSSCMAIWPCSSCVEVFHASVHVDLEAEGFASWKELHIEGDMTKVDDCEWSLQNITAWGTRTFTTFTDDDTEHEIEPLQKGASVRCRPKGYDIDSFESGGVLVADGWVRRVFLCFPYGLVFRYNDYVISDGCNMIGSAQWMQAQYNTVPPGNPECSPGQSPWTDIDAANVTAIFS